MISVVYLVPRVNYTHKQLWNFMRNFGILGIFPHKKGTFSNLEFSPTLNLEIDSAALHYNRLQTLGSRHNVVWYVMFNVGRQSAYSFHSLTVRTFFYPCPSVPFYFYPDRTTRRC